MAEPYRIRPTAPADLAELTLLEQAAFSDPWSSEMLREAIASPGTISLLAEDAEGRVAASALARLIGDEGELLSIAVDPARRGQGLGRRLLNDVLRRLTRGGASTVWLEVRSSNAAALSLYHSAGFVAAGSRRGYYRRPIEDAVIMKRQLPTD